MVFQTENAVDDAHPNSLAAPHLPHHDPLRPRQPPGRFGRPPRQTAQVYYLHYVL